MATFEGWEREERWTVGCADRCDLYVRHVDYGGWHGWWIVVTTPRNLSHLGLSEKMALDRAMTTESVQPECERYGEVAGWVEWRLGYSMRGLEVDQCATKEDASRLFDKARELFDWLEGN